MNALAAKARRGALSAAEEGELRTIVALAGYWSCSSPKHAFPLNVHRLQRDLMDARLEAHVQRRAKIAASTVAFRHT